MAPKDDALITLLDLMVDTDAQRDALNALIAAGAPAPAPTAPPEKPKK